MIVQVTQPSNRSKQLKQATARSGVARVKVLGGRDPNAEGVSHSRGVRGHAPWENFEI